MSDYQPPLSAAELQVMMAIGTEVRLRCRGLATGRQSLANILAKRMGKQPNARMRALCALPDLQRMKPGTLQALAEAIRSPASADSWIASMAAVSPYDPDGIPRPMTVADRDAAEPLCPGTRRVPDTDHQPQPDPPRPLGLENPAAATPLESIDYVNAAIPEGHFLSNAAGFTGLHRLVLFDKIGAGPHPCHWCLRPVDWLLDFEAKLYTDHLDWNKANNDPGNLVPACQRCNCLRVPSPQMRSILRARGWFQ